MNHHHHHHRPALILGNPETTILFLKHRIISPVFPPSGLLVGAYEYLRWTMAARPVAALLALGRATGEVGVLSLLPNPSLLVQKL